MELVLENGIWVQKVEETQDETGTKIGSPQNNMAANYFREHWSNKQDNYFDFMWNPNQEMIEAARQAELNQKR